MGGSTSGSANGDSLIGLEAVFVGETEREWLAEGEFAWGMLFNADQYADVTHIRWNTYFSGLGIAVPTVL